MSTARTLKFVVLPVLAGVMLTGCGGSNSAQGVTCRQWKALGTGSLATLSPKQEKMIKDALAAHKKNTWKPNVIIAQTELVTWCGISDSDFGEGGADALIEDGMNWK